MKCYENLLQRFAEARRRLVLATPTPDCPGCVEKRLHTADEKKKFHPFTGHGMMKGQGYSHPDLTPKEEKNP